MAYLLCGQIGFSELKQQALSFASANQFIPTMANNPGQGGAFFKTKLSILNVTDFNYSVVITFFSKTGKSPQQSFQLKAREMRTWDNFLEAFGYQGAGAVEFDSWFDPPGGSDDFEFILSSETYTDSPNGRYKTVVWSGENIGTTFPAYSPGVSVGPEQRTNLGCYNSSSAQTVIAELHSASGRTHEATNLAPGGSDRFRSGALDICVIDSVAAKSYPIFLVDQGWNQIPLPDPVVDGYVHWIPQSSCSCWAVVVDNRSNDGSFIPASEYIQ